MKNLARKLFNACFPVIILILISFFFLYKTQYATYGHYTYNIKSQGQTLVIMSGLNYVGETITIENEVITFQGNLFKYEVNNINGNLRSVTFFLPDGNNFSINGFSLSNVNFHNNSKTVIHGESAEINDNQQNDIREILITTTIVHLRIIQLHDHFENYFFIHIILLIWGYWIYMKPNFVKNFMQKSIYKHYDINIFCFKIIGLLIIVISASIPFIFLI